MTRNQVKLVSAVVFSFCCTVASIHAASLPNESLKHIADDGLYQPETSPSISFDFQNIDIKALLQLIAKNSGMNFMISDQIKGNISISLRDVTWKQALNIILKSQGLTSRQIGNVLFVSTLDEIVTTEAKELKSAEALANVSPLKSELLKLNYTNATEIAELLKGKSGTLLSPRGQVAVDVRTNSLIIRDTSNNLKELAQAIKKLDVPTRQVLIEARIVSIDTTYEQELGIRFGMSDTRHLTGTLAGANQLAQGTAINAIDPLINRLNFNVPAANLSTGSTPASMGLALAKLGHFFLDLELSALEGESHAQIISRPRVITSNQQKATIQTGEEIPYQEATSSGATSVVFKKAVLSLEIVPQITPNNKIILRLKATQDTRGDNIQTGSAGGVTTTIPAINTQAVESNILLNNNETIVLGGVYKINKEKGIERVPFLGSLPGIGYLFRHVHERSEKNELLIFITPKIITADTKATHNAKVDDITLNTTLHKDEE